MLRGDLIKKYRVRFNMTQEELAKRTKTSPQNIYKYEKGEIRNIPIWRLELMAQIFDVSPSVLAGWEPDPEEVESFPPVEWAQIYTQVNNMLPQEQVAFGREILLRLDKTEPHYLSEQELSLVKAWRRTDDVDKLSAVALLLGFPYEEPPAKSSAG